MKRKDYMPVPTERLLWTGGVVLGASLPKSESAAVYVELPAPTPPTAAADVIMG